MEAGQVAGEPVGGPAEGVIGVARRRAAVGAASVGGEERLEIAVGDERLDLVAVASRCRAGHRDGSSRSRATLRRARWMRTRTAPSERPRTPAISAVDISSTKRRISARRRSSGRRPTADQAAATSSFARGVAFDVDRAGHRAGSLERRFRAATQACGVARRRRCARSGRARPGTSRRPRHRPGVRAPRTGRGSSGRRGTCARWRPPPRDGRATRRRRSCTPGPGTSDRGPRTGPGPPGPPRRAVGHGRGGRDADHPPPDGPPS